MTNLEYRLFDFKIYNSNDGAYESDDSDDAMKSGFEIQMFGINQKGETCSMIIQNYKPFFYIKVPNNWNKSKVREFQSDLYKRLGPQSSQIYKIKLDRSGCTFSKNNFFSSTFGSSATKSFTETKNEGE